MLLLIPVLALQFWPLGWLLATETGRANTLAAQSTSVRVTELSHEIDYGQAIRIRLKAQSDSEIVAVKGWFRPRGPGRISSYTYPEFTPGTTISATFLIKTGSGAYFPPGTEFDYRFEMVTSDGTVTETSTQLVEYLDPGREWKRQTEDGLTAVYYNIDDVEVRRLVDYARQRLPVLLATTGAESGGTFKAVLYRSVSDASSSFPPVSQTATDRQFFAGFAEPGFGLFVLGSPGQGTFIHELTHLLVARAVESPSAAPVPAWLNEGLAVWAEGGASPDDARFRSAASSGQLLKLRSMGTIPGRGRDIDLFYPQAGAFVSYLHSRFGPEGIAALLEDLDGGKKVYDAAAERWGVSLDDVENEWRVSMGAKPLATPGPALPAGTPVSRPTISLATAMPFGTAPSLAAPAPTPEPQSSTFDDGRKGAPVRVYVGLAFAAVAIGGLVAFAVRRKIRA